MTVISMTHSGINANFKAGDYVRTTEGAPLSGWLMSGSLRGSQHSSMPFGTFLACNEPEVSMTRSLLCLTSILFTGFVAAKADIVSAGTQIQVRPDTEIRVDKWDRGRIYYGHIARDVTARDGDLASLRAPFHLVQSMPR